MVHPFLLRQLTRTVESQLASKWEKGGPAEPSRRFPRAPPVPRTMLAVIHATPGAASCVHLLGARLVPETGLAMSPQQGAPVHKFGRWRPREHDNPVEDRAVVGPALDCPRCLGREPAWI